MGCLLFCIKQLYVKLPDFGFILSQWAKQCWLTLDLSICYEWNFFYASSHYLYSCSIQEDLLHLAPLRHPQTLPVAMKKEGQEDPSPGPRDQRRKRSPSQEARMLEAIVKTRVQFVFQDSLGTSRVNSAWILVVYHKKNYFMQIVNCVKLYFYDQHVFFLYRICKFVCHFVFSFKKIVFSWINLCVRWRGYWVLTSINFNATLWRKRK